MTLPPGQQACTYPLSFLLLMGLAAVSGRGEPPASGPFKPLAEAPGLFQAIEGKLIDARLILDNSRQGVVVIRNQAGKPIRVRLPGAFAGVPIVPPAEPPKPPPQKVGGGFPRDDQNMTEDNYQGPLVSVPAGETSRVKAVTVCLDPYLPEPSPSAWTPICPSRRPRSITRSSPSSWLPQGRPWASFAACWVARGSTSGPCKRRPGTCTTASVGRSFRRGESPRQRARRGPISPRRKSGPASDLRHK